MPIDYSRLRTVSAREIINALKRDRFFLRNQAGSHQRYYHSDGRRVTVSFHHPSDTFPPKTLKTMIEYQARWTEDDLKRLKLLLMPIELLEYDLDLLMGYQNCVEALLNPAFPRLHSLLQRAVWVSFDSQCALGTAAVCPDVSLEPTGDGRGGAD